MRTQRAMLSLFPWLVVMLSVTKHLVAYHWSVFLPDRSSYMDNNSEMQDEVSLQRRWKRFPRFNHLSSNSELPTLSGLSFAQFNLNVIGGESRPYPSVRKPIADNSNNEETTKDFVWYRDEPSIDASANLNFLASSSISPVKKCSDLDVLCPLKLLDCDQKDVIETCPRTCGACSIPYLDGNKTANGI
ncbi:hypothetical protein ACOME3_002665 [Neoechinorhynchus agilis]